MSRLIDADELKTIRSINKANFNSIETIQAWIDSAPTVDAVEVVRCKDCIHSYMSYDGLCKYCELTTDDEGNLVELYYGGDFFCAWGERKTE